MSEKVFQSNIAIHPGETLLELLEAVGMSQSELAERSGLTVKTVNEIVQSKNPITPETANKFSAIFGMSAQFWNSLQRNFDETLARLERDKSIQDELRYLPKFTCYRELAKWNFVPETSNRAEKVQNLMNFFGVSSLSLVGKVHAIAFRKAKHKDVSGESLAAWLRCGELSAQKEFQGIENFQRREPEAVSADPASLNRTARGSFPKEDGRSLRCFWRDGHVCSVFPEDLRERRDEVG